MSSQHHCSKKKAGLYEDNGEKKTAFPPYSFVFVNQSSLKKNTKKLLFFGPFL